VAAGRKLFASLDAGPVWLVLAEGTAPPRDLPGGVEIVTVAAGPLGRPDPKAMLLELGRRGLTRVLVEGGARLAGALMKAGLVDRIAWFRAPLALGGDGVPALEPLGIADPAAAAKWKRIDQRRLGEDTLEYLARR
jgi:diaminohydroxyphosphoribosylaminopyrimidine deaminase/5-amino-6-(5-phosphoribosylamino)uracil reductase